jgi:multiple sugar transport system ATP-binding protein
MAEVSLKEVTKVYEGGQEAVKGVSLEVKDKEFLVLVGPSGCGKSTTLRMIAGLEDITSGELYIDGRLVNEVSPKDRDIAMVFQNYALYPHMTVYENMAFGLKIRKFPKGEIKQRVEEAARVLEIEHLLTRKPKALSGGERQRVAVGRAIVRRPKVFLFDEPLSNLDAKLRVQMRTEISKLHQRLQATMIYVTHDQTEAMTMGDRIVVMKGGLVMQTDSPLNLYNSPKNRFVAGFIGSPPMNFLEGTVSSVQEGGGERFTDTSGRLSFRLKPGLKDLPSAGRRVTLGIRPEDIMEKDGGLDVKNSDDFEAVEVTLEVVEPMGNEIFLYFTLGESQFISRIPAREKPEVGTKMRLYFRRDKFHFFDSESELAL